MSVIYFLLQWHEMNERIEIRLKYQNQFDGKSKNHYYSPVNAFGLNTSVNNTAFFVWPIKAQHVNNVGGINDADKLSLLF